MKDSEKPSESGFPLTRNTPQAEPTPTTPSPQARSRSAARPRTAWTYTKFALGTLFCMVFMAAGAVLGNFYWRSATIRQMVATIMTTPSALIHHPFDPLGAFQPDEQFDPAQQHTVTVLVLGCDADYEPGRPVPVKGANGRSDAILIARINYDNKTIQAMSIPRDTAVRIPGHGIQKINAANAIGGPELAQQVIKDTFGISTDYYLTVDFQGFQKIVDAIGGVDLTVDKQLDYDDNWGNLHVHLKPGYQHLNGYHAMGFVRMRHSDDDLHRAERQHVFIEALRKKVTNRDNFMKLPDVLNALMDSIKTKLTVPQLMTIGNFARQLKREQITIATLPVIEGPSYCYALPDKDSAVISKLFFDSELPVVSVSVPERGLLIGDSRRIRRRRRHGISTTVESRIPREETDQPLATDPNADGPMLDGQPTPDNSGNDANNDTSTTAPKDNGNSSSGTSGSSDSGKSSGGDSGAGASGNDSGTSAPVPLDGASGSGSGTDSGGGNGNGQTGK